MDLDRYLATHRPMWDRLSYLSAQGRRRPGALMPHEADELVDLYQQVSTQLSFARNHYADPALTAELTAIVAAANATLYRRTSSPLGALRRFFAVSFPAAVWHLRVYVVLAAASMLVPTLILGLWLAETEEALTLAVGPEAHQAAIVEEDFEAYYSSAPAGQFATELLVNNIQVSFFAFAAGALLFGAGSVVILAMNGASLGSAWALFIVAGEQARFWGLILPHGLLELTAAIVAGAAGMSLGWSVVAPGDRSRGRAFTEEARRSVVIVIGLMLAFVTAAIIEAFVTPSGLPTIARVGIGLAVETLAVVYVVGFGRRAAAQDFTGLVEEGLEGPSARSALRL